MPGSKFDQHLELYHYLVTHTRIRLSDQKLEYYLFTDDTMMCIDHPDRKAWQISTSNMALRDALRILGCQSHSQRESWLHHNDDETQRRTVIMTDEHRLNVKAKVLEMVGTHLNLDVKGGELSPLEKKEIAFIALATDKTLDLLMPILESK